MLSSIIPDALSAGTDSWNPSTRQLQRTNGVRMRTMAGEERTGVSCVATFVVLFSESRLI